MNSDLQLLVPPVPQDTVYTSYYCEENIYLLAQAFAADPIIAGIWDISVIFISNHKKTARVFSESLSSETEADMLLGCSLVSTTSE